MHLKWWLRSSMRWVPGRWGNALETTEHRANVTALGALWTLQQAPTPRHTPSDLPRNVRTFPGKLNSSLRALLPRRDRTRPQNQGRIYRADRRYAKPQPQTPQNCDPEASWRFCVRDNLRVKTQLPVFTVSSPAVLTANRCAIAGHRCGEATGDLGRRRAQACLPRWGGAADAGRRSHCACARLGGTERRCNPWLTSASAGFSTALSGVGAGSDAQAERQQQFSTCA